MIGLTEARRIATEWARADDPDATVGLHEFELGYVAWRRDDRPLPEREFGAPCAVIDHETGELTLWPSLAAPRVARLYRRRVEAYRRFPADARAMLRLGGWRPGRDVAALVRAWWAGTGATDPPPPGAEAVLNEFGGLRMRTLGWTFVPQRPDEPPRFRPTPSPPDEAPRLHRVPDRPGERALTVADLGGEPVAVDAAGRAYLRRDGGPDLVAESFARLLVALLRPPDGR